MREWFENVYTTRFGLAIIAFVVISITIVTTTLSLPSLSFSLVEQNVQVAAMASDKVTDVFGNDLNKKDVLPPVTHIATPSPLKGIYMTSCIAGSPKYRGDILAMMSGSKINSLVIDIKDYTGTLAYSGTKVSGPKGKGCKITDLPAFIAQLHKKNIYTIARITVFQDPLYANAYPDIAVQSISSVGRPWRDKKGLSYIDPTFKSYWNYIVSISKEAYSIGFDEINFDYIRFPSDGDMSDALFAIPSGVSKVTAMEDFFAFLQTELKPLGIVMSADIFGQTAINRDDLGIGQILENILPYFDYVMPMVYPSHFIPGFLGYEKPAEYPYEVIKFAMISSVERAVAASSTPNKIRPWLQAFDLGAVYTPQMVHKQVQGVMDAGLDSWVLWDAANRYSKEEF